MMRPTLILVSSLLLPVIGATAQIPAPDAKPMTTPQAPCTAAAALPPAFASFAHPVPAAEASGVFLGQAVALDLGPGTHFLVPPGHVPAGGTFGGTVGFDVTDLGTYRVAIGAAIWVDLLRGSTAVRSTAHAPGPACTGVRKTVDFVLTPGHYMLQFSGSPTPSVTFQVAKAS